LWGSIEESKILPGSQMSGIILIILKLGIITTLKQCFKATVLMTLKVSPLLLFSSFKLTYLGPCHVYLKETKEQKARYTSIIKAYNLKVLLQL